MTSIPAQVTTAAVKIDDGGSSPPRSTNAGFVQR